MNPKFIISHLDMQLGPFDEAELKAKWVKGEILPIDYVYDEAKQDWVLMSDRFSWASGRAEIESPPPLREITVRKKMPVAEDSTAPTQVFAPEKTVTMTDVHIGAVTQPSINVAAAAAAATSVKKAIAPPVAIAPPAAIPVVGTPVAPAPVAVQPKVAVTVPPAQVKMVDGQGEIDLSSLQPGSIELIAQDSAGKIRTQNPVKIQVKAAEPVSVEWNFLAQQVVGNDLEVNVRALDAGGHICSHYEDMFMIRVAGSEAKDFPVNMKNGVAVVKIHHTRAEIWKCSFHYSGSRVMKLPVERGLEWQPGPAARLIVDGQAEYVAGHPMKVQVKAVDEFGNLAKTYSGTVVLEVKAS